MYNLKREDFRNIDGHVHLAALKLSEVYTALGWYTTHWVPSDTETLYDGFVRIVNELIDCGLVRINKDGTATTCSTSGVKIEITNYNNYPEISIMADIDNIFSNKS